MLRASELTKNFMYMFWEDREPLPNNTFYVTELLDCPIKVYYNRLSEYQSKPNKYTVVGNLIHEKFDKILKGLSFEPDGFERSIMYEEDDIVIKGRADYMGKIDGKDTILELKTSVSTEVKDIWKQQLRFYSYATGIKRLYLIIYNTRYGSFMVKKVMPKSQDAEAMVRKAKLLHIALDSKNPESLYLLQKRLSDKCTYCQYKDLCEIWSGAYGK